VKQAIWPDYVPTPCPYCSGRGFVVLENSIDTRNPEKQKPSSVVFECKFCGGTGRRVRTD
jgi:hypothetical protein